MIKKCDKMRLQRYLAICGIGSRRKCEEYILQGRVKVDGKIINELGVKIDPEKNLIFFDNKEIKPEEVIWLKLNKPTKYICSSNDPKIGPSYLELLPNNLGRLYAVGRLDYMSEGLLLITNDGEVAYKLTHPKYEIKKTYELKTLKTISEKKIKILRNGIKSNNEILKLVDIKQNEKSISPCYIITLSQGKYRHIRRMMKEINIPIKSLKRISIGPTKLGNIKIGEYKILTNEEINELKMVVKSI